jgi:hypothetical protein
MELFREVGQKLEDLWRAKDYDETVFPAMAAEALKNADLPAKVSPWDVVEWTLQQNELPRQKDVHGRFGEPPITLFVAPHFHIDVYFWFEGTTTVHQHGFCGAFQVLEGSSIHSWYEFERRDAVNSFCEIGEMSLKLCELLEVGAVQEIRPGRQYIHSLFHLDQPSVTIVVRTDKSPLFLPQYDYQKPSVAVDPFYEHESTTKKLQTVTALFRAQHPDTDRMLSNLLETADFHTAFLILRTARSMLAGNRLNEVFNISTPQERFANYLNLVCDRHGERGEELCRVFARMDRLDEILKRRSFVTNPEHRFFLALLLNVDGKENIFSLIKQRYPNDDPIEKILDWVLELSETRVMAANSSNALGIDNFGPFDLFILENLLQDRGPDEMKAAIENDYPADQAENLRSALPKKIDQLYQAIIFQPLFDDSRAKTAVI